MPMANYISPLSNDSLSNLCKELGKNNSINPADFERYSRSEEHTSELQSR